MGAFSDYKAGLMSKNYDQESRAAKLRNMARLATKSELFDMNMKKDSKIIDPAEVYDKQQKLNESKGLSTTEGKLGAANAILKASGAGGANSSPLSQGVMSGLSAGLATMNPYVAAASMALGTFSASSKKKIAEKNRAEEFRYKAESRALDRTQEALNRLATMELGL